MTKKINVTLILFRVLIISTISLLVIIPTSRYFELRLNYDSRYYVEINNAKILAILALNLLCFSLLFIVKINYYIRVFKIMLIAFITISIYVLIQNMQLPRDIWNIWVFFIFLTFSMISPGLILMIIYYIRNQTSKFDNATLLGKYHIHEGFVGIIFLIIAISLFFINNIPTSVNNVGFDIVSAVLQVMIFFFLFLASFFIIRDRVDVRKLKFIERKDKTKGAGEGELNLVFNRISKEDLHFFKGKKFVYYPFGMFLTFLSINLITFVSGFVPIKYFNTLEYDINLILLIGYISCIAGGGLIGLDWLRLFRRYYPELYRDLEEVLIKLKEI